MYTRFLLRQNYLLYIPYHYVKLYHLHYILESIL
nr:MAG TPA: hypothetical protein [Crassvirales sp.]